MRKNQLVSVVAVALSAAALLITPGFAADPPAAPAATATATTAKHHKVNQRERILKALNLTDAQKDQLKAIQKSAREQTKAIRKDTTLTADQRKAKMKDLRKDTQDKLLAVLTPDQQTKFKAMMKAARHKGKHAANAAK